MRRLGEHVWRFDGQSRWIAASVCIIDSESNNEVIETKNGILWKVWISKIIDIVPTIPFRLLGPEVIVASPVIPGGQDPYRRLVTPSLTPLHHTSKPITFPHPRTRGQLRDPNTKRLQYQSWDPQGGYLLTRRFLTAKSGVKLTGNLDNSSSTSIFLPPPTDPMIFNAPKIVSH